MSPRNGIRLGKSRGSVQEISQVMESGIKWWRQLIVLVHFRHLTVTEGWVDDMLYCRGNWWERSGNSTLDIHQVTHWLAASWMCTSCLILLSRCPKSQHLMGRFLHVQHNASMVYANAQCLSVCHESVFYRNGWEDQADVWEREIMLDLCYIVL